jgi:uncharacterized membrane protein
MAKKNKLQKTNSKTGQAVQSSKSKKPTVSTPLHPWIEAILRPQSIFLFLAVVFGLIFAFTLPPFQVPDEAAHMFRAYQLSKFEFKVETQTNVYGNYLPPSPDNAVAGTYLPSSLDSVQMKFAPLRFHPERKTSKKEISEASAIKLEPDKVKFTEMTAGNYSHISYLPQLPAIYVGRLLNLNVLTIFYLGRIFALAFYIFCVWYSIRIAPFGKNIFLALGLIPMSLSLAGSYSGDCVAISFAFLAVSLSLYLSSQAKINLKDTRLILLMTIVSLYGVLKPIYFPFVLLILLLPPKSFAVKREYYMMLAITFVTALLFTLGWRQISIINTILNPDIVAKEIIQTPSYQFHLLLNNPLILFDILSETLKAKSTFYYNSLIGILGYLDTRLPKWIYNTYYMLMIFVAFLDYKKSYIFSIFQRTFLLVLSVGMFLLTIYAMFIMDGIESKDTLVTQGVQGRYFIPILIVFLPVLYGVLPFKKFLASVNTIITVAIFLICFVVLYQVQHTLYLRYFVEGNDYLQYIQ